MFELILTIRSSKNGYVVQNYVVNPLNLENTQLSRQQIISVEMESKHSEIVAQMCTLPHFYCVSKVNLHIDRVKVNTGKPSGHIYYIYKYI